MISFILRVLGGVIAVALLRSNAFRGTYRPRFDFDMILVAVIVGLSYAIL